MKISEELLIPDDSLSISEGGIKTLTPEQNILYTEVRTVADYYNIDLSLPIKKLEREKLDKILYGSDVPLEFNYLSRTGSTRKKVDYFEGIITNLERRQIETTATWVRDWIQGFMIEMECPKCHGTR
jgi:excinuclease ABC subunit A